tara:strand:+ start:935 stop:1300 length:366 start_codon:yes stop_codon:yes gene_type:complete
MAKHYIPRTTNTTTFGISLRGRKAYTGTEVEQFWEAADNIEPAELMHSYRNFLEGWLAGQIRKNTIVDIDVLELFAGDLDNRADIDYREGHWDDEPNIVAGGAYFAKKQAELYAHIKKAKA